MYRRIQWFFTDKNGRLVLYQRPNAPIICWAVATVLAHFMHGRLHNALALVATLSLAYWAVLEIYAGATPFRRVLGGAVLALIIVSRFW